MNPQYVQTASLQPPGAQHQVSFTNLSSQQLTPGNLVGFFNAQDRSRQPMPFTDADIQTDRSGVAQKLSEANNIDQMSQAATLPEFFAMNNPGTTDAHFMTPEQRVWHVPRHLLEARATEMF